MSRKIILRQNVAWFVSMQRGGPDSPTIVLFQCHNTEKRQVSAGTKSDYHMALWTRTPSLDIQCSPALHEFGWNCQPTYKVLFSDIELIYLVKHQAWAIYKDRKCCFEAPYIVKTAGEVGHFEIQNYPLYLVVLFLFDYHIRLMLHLRTSFSKQKIRDYSVDESWFTISI